MVSPLVGKHIVITRAPSQSDGLDALLRECGAHPLHYPCINIAPIPKADPLHSAVRALNAGRFNLLILTSTNTVHALQTYGANPPAHTSIIAIGPSTARAAASAGWAVKIISEQHTAEGLVNALPAPKGLEVFLPQSALADDTLGNRLAARGAHVTCTAAYTVTLGTGGVDLPTLLRTRRVDAITLASPSAFHNLLIRLKAEGSSSDALNDVVLASIGPTTTQTLRDAGYANIITASPSTANGLIDALSTYFRYRPEDSPA